MTDRRWKKLMKDDKAKLTNKEMLEGWHWCNDFDGLLVGPGMREMDICTCGDDAVTIKTFYGNIEAAQAAEDDILGIGF